jgi:hypothetical protein
MTTQTLAGLLGDLQRGPGVRQALRDALSGTGVAGKAVRQSEARLGDTLANVLDTDVGDLVLHAWTTQSELGAAMRRTRGGLAESEDVVLADHTITSTHHPSIEVHVNETRVATVTFDVDLSIVLQSVVAVVINGDIAEFRSGDVVLRATLSTSGQVIVERAKTCFVGALFQAEAAGPLVNDGSGTRRRLSRRGGLVLAGVLILAAGAVAQAAESIELPPTSPVQEGVAGSVRPGTEWNVRTGPSKDSRSLGVVRLGEPVRVSCLDGNWAKLISPQRDAFVHTDGLTLDSTPPAC